MISKPRIDKFLLAKNNQFSYGRVNNNLILLQITSFFQLLTALKSVNINSVYCIKQNKNVFLQRIICFAYFYYVMSSSCSKRADRKKLPCNCTRGDLHRKVLDAEQLCIYKIYIHNEQSCLR